MFLDLAAINAPGMFVGVRFTPEVAVAFVG
jgi:hypothetical protein